MEEIKTKVDIKTFSGANMFERFMKEPFPSVCVSGRFNISNLIKLKKKYKSSFNAMMCFCIMQAAQNIKEFHYSIQSDGSLWYYKNVKANSVVNGNNGELYYADYKYFDNFKDFQKEYYKVNEYCAKNNTHFQEDTGALISTSAVVGFPFTSFSLGNSLTFWDNFLMWGKYVKKFRKSYLDISLRFHHALIDGQRASLFFNELQKQFNKLKI